MWTLIGILCSLVAAFCAFGTGIESVKNSRRTGTAFIAALVFGLFGALAFYNAGQDSVEARSVAVQKLEVGKVYVVKNLMHLNVNKEGVAADRVLAIIYEQGKFKHETTKLYLLDTVPPKVFIKTQNGRYLSYRPEKK